MTFDQQLHHVAAILPYLRLWPEWRVCDPIQGAALTAVRTFAKRFGVGDLNYASGLWSKPKANLTFMILPDPNTVPNWLAQAVEHTSKDGEIALLTSMAWLPTCDVDKRVADLHPLKSTDCAFAWFIYSTRSEARWSVIEEK